MARRPTTTPALLLSLFASTAPCADAGHCERAQKTLKGTNREFSEALSARTTVPCVHNDDDDDDGGCSNTYTTESYQGLKDAQNPHLSVNHDLMQLDCPACCEEYFHAAMGSPVGKSFRYLSLLSDGPPPTTANDTLDNLWLVGRGKGREDMPENGRSSYAGRLTADVTSSQCLSEPYMRNEECRDFHMIMMDWVSLQGLESRSNLRVAAD